jgi:hypothetical protein
VTTSSFSIGVLFRPSLRRTSGRGVHRVAVDEELRRAVGLWQQREVYVAEETAECVGL